MNESEFKALLPDLVRSYTPNMDVAHKLRNLTMIPVVGPTCVGKTTVIAHSQVSVVVTDATRDPRPDEIEGVDGFFRKDYAEIVNQVRRGEFVQIAIGSEGDFKGTRLSSYPDEGSVAAPITAAAVPIFYRLGFKAVTPVFIVPPSFEAWQSRLTERRSSEDAALFARRMQEAEQSFDTALADDAYTFIVNDKLQHAVEDFIAVMHGTYTRTQSEAARRVAQSIRSRLN